jgi:hypothetical protein
VTGQANLAWVEETLKAAALRDAARLLGKFYSEVLPRVLAIEQPAGSCGRRRRTVLSTVGPVELVRPYVVDHDGRRSFPLDEALGLVGGCTPAAAGLIAWAGAQSASYDLAGDALSRLAGIHVPGRRVQRMINRVAADEAAWAQSRPKEDHPGGILNIQTDMTGIPMRKEDLVGVAGKNGDPKKRQIKGGIVFRQVTNRKGEVQRVPHSTTRIVSFEDVPSFSKALLTEAVARGYHTADTVVFTADGAEWIWLMVEDRFKGAVQIVDFYHAAEHLGLLCRLAQPDKQKAEAMFALRRRLMRDYGAACVIRYFQRLPADHPKKAEIDAALNYFTTNLKRMDYRTFRAKGFFIGSGAMEGTCKSLVKQRADLAGQRWHPSGSLNVLRVRALVADQLHDRYWNQRASLGQRLAA